MSCCLNELRWQTHLPGANELTNTLRLRQNGRNFADDIFKCIFLNENAWILLKISLKFVPKVRINNIPALVQIMAWRRPCDYHYLNQWWLVYWRIYASLGLNELMVLIAWVQHASLALQVNHFEEIHDVTSAADTRLSNVTIFRNLGIYKLELKMQVKSMKRGLCVPVIFLLIFKSCFWNNDYVFSSFFGTWSLLWVKSFILVSRTNYLVENGWDIRDSKKIWLVPSVRIWPITLLSGIPHGDVWWWC